MMSANSATALHNPRLEDQKSSLHEGKLLAALAGDYGAFGELCQRYSSHLLRTIHRITRNNEDSEDALQDTLMRAFLHLRSFDHRAQFSTWLTRIAINSALMILRRRKRHGEISIDSSRQDEGRFAQWEIPDDADDPEGSLLKGEKDEQLRRAIEDLDHKLRIALEVWLAQGAAEGARRLNISRAALKSRVTRAKLALRAEIAIPNKAKRARRSAG